VIASLFNAQVKWLCNKRVGSAPDGIEESTVVTKDVDKAILATGLLSTKYEVATVRFADYIDQCNAEKQQKKLFWLLNDGGKKAHSLVLRDAPWEFGPVTTIDEDTTKTEKSPVKSELKVVADDEKMRVFKNE